MSITRYDLDANADGYFDDPFMKVREQGKFILYSDHATLLARHTALVDAVEWLVECEYFYRWTTQYHCLVPHEWKRVVYHARAEVDKLLEDI